MTGIVADNDVIGLLHILQSYFESDSWREIWSSLQCSVYTFKELGLAADSTDRAIWQECQRRQVVLITANRNEDGPDSLAAVIRELNTPGALPVFTLTDPPRIATEKPYATRVAERLLEYFMRIDEVRGTGRLFVP